MTCCCTLLLYEGLTPDSKIAGWASELVWPFTQGIALALTCREADNPGQTDTHDRAELRTSTARACCGL
jgi:hypothetical protein